MMMFPGLQWPWTNLAVRSLHCCLSQLTLLVASCEEWAHYLKRSSSPGEEIRYIIYYICVCSGLCLVCVLFTFIQQSFKYNKWLLENFDAWPTLNRINAWTLWYSVLTFRKCICVQNRIYVYVHTYKRFTEALLLMAEGWKPLNAHLSKSAVCVLMHTHWNTVLLVSRQWGSVCVNIEPSGSYVVKWKSESQNSLYNVFTIKRQLLWALIHMYM